MRVDIKDHKWENASIIYQILSADFTRKCTEIDVENLYVDVGGLKGEDRLSNTHFLFIQDRAGIPELTRSKNVKSSSEFTKRHVLGKSYGKKYS